MSVPDLTSAYVHRPLGKEKRICSLTPHLSLASLIVKIFWSRATHALGSAIRLGFRTLATHVGILQALLDRSDDIPRQNILPRSLFVHCVLYRHYPLTRRPRLKYVCICCAHCGGTDAVLYSTPSSSYSRRTLIFSSSNCHFLSLTIPVLRVSLCRWIPDNVSVTLCSVPPVGHKQSATCLANTTAIQELFTRSLSQVCHPSHCRHAG
jgi:hypothetical protein